MKPAEPRITDLQFVHLLCKLPIPEVAAHTGQNTVKVMEELNRTPMPPELRNITNR